MSRSGDQVYYERRSVELGWQPTDFTRWEYISKAPTTVLQHTSRKGSVQLRDDGANADEYLVTSYGRKDDENADIAWDDDAHYVALPAGIKLSNNAPRRTAAAIDQAHSNSRRSTEVKFGIESDADDSPTPSLSHSCVSIFDTTPSAKSRRLSSKEAMFEAAPVLATIKPQRGTLHQFDNIIEVNGSDVRRSSNISGHSGSILGQLGSKSQHESNVSGPEVIAEAMSHRRSIQQQPGIYAAHEYKMESLSLSQSGSGQNLRSILDVVPDSKSRRLTAREAMFEAMPLIGSAELADYDQLLSSIYGTTIDDHDENDDGSAIRRTTRRGTEFLDDLYPHGSDQTVTPQNTTENAIVSPFI